MADNTFSFTRDRVRGLPFPKQGRITYRDTSTTGLQLRVSSDQNKIYSFVGKLNGRTKRVSIGGFDDMTLKQAQDEATSIRQQLKKGIDPIAGKRAAKAANITLQFCFDDYMASADLKQTTRKQYIAEFNKHLGAWSNKPLKAIKRTEIATKHKTIGKRNPALANRVMRMLRALYNFAHFEYRDKADKSLFPENPVKHLTHKKQWNKIKPRDGFIDRHELKDWFEATEQLPNYSEYGRQARDYLQLVILTGLRLNEALTLKWEHIDFKAHALTVPETKNRKAHKIPLSDYVYDLLMQRFKSQSSNYVFPARYDSSHMTRPQKSILKVREITGSNFTIHDLRRTFITIAEGLDISQLAVKKLVNHSIKGNVTADYTQITIERLRAPMQKITDYIIKSAGIEPNDNVINLLKRKSM